MISEEELDLALELQKEIKELKITIVKLEEARISRSQAGNTGISIDSCKIEVDGYTQHIIQKFKDDMVHVHNIKLQALKAKYGEIIESPEDALMRIVKDS